MQVYDHRDRHPDSVSRPDLYSEHMLDDGAFSPYGVACIHEARRVIELALGPWHLLLSCAECGATLGVAVAPAA
ncbi:MAG: hypothetical protein M3Q65_23245 [Chloroflexota bacterium]|nr:hypothetical protein [Chloroflexota bacterium]